MYCVIAQGAGIWKSIYVVLIKTEQSSWGFRVTIIAVGKWNAPVHVRLETHLFNSKQSRVMFEGKQHNKLTSVIKVRC